MPLNLAHVVEGGLVLGKESAVQNEHLSHSPIRPSTDGAATDRPCGAIACKAVAAVVRAGSHLPSDDVGERQPLEDVGHDRHQVQLPANKPESAIASLACLISTFISISFYSTSMQRVCFIL